MARTTAFTLGSFHPKPNDVTYQGDASALGDLLSLTKIDSNSLPVTQSVGRVLYSKPVQFWETGRQAIFDTTITFRIDRSTINDHLGEGIAFFIAPVDTTIPNGSVGGNLGIFEARGNSPNLFAVEFDSFPNDWDPANPHIGIDINSRESMAVTDFDDFIGKDVTATITYREKTVTVVAYTSTKTFTINYGVDLKGVLPQNVQVGISASTGPNQVQFNYIRSWSFTSTLVRDV